MTVDRALLSAALPAYEVGTELGRGAWGIVVAARHRQLQRDVAVKQLPPAFSADPAVQARFVAEARMLASLDHPHIVPIYDFVERDGVCLLVMEQLAGGTAWSRSVNRSLDVATACAIGLVTAVALQHAHDRGVLHRDIKPENLLFSRDGAHLKVGDFGIAKVLSGDQAMVTSTGEVVGTPAYMAPEQATGAAVTAATDVYALGVSLYEMLSGRLPFAGESPISILYQRVHEAPMSIFEAAPALPGPLGEIVMSAIATDPADRPSSAEALALALADAVTSLLGSGWVGRTGIRASLGGQVAALTERPGPAPALPVVPDPVQPSRRARAADGPSPVEPENLVPVADLAELIDPGPLPGQAPAQPPDAGDPVGRRGHLAGVADADLVAGQAVGLVDEIVAQARRAGRGDLAGLLADVTDRWADPEVTVLLLGERGVGKSALAGALVGHHGLLPTGSTPTTGSVTAVRVEPDASAVSVTAHVGGRTGPVPVPIADLARWVTLEDRPSGVARVDVEVPGADLPARTVLLDTPGVAGPASSPTEADSIVPALLGRTDVLLYVADPTAPLGRAALDLLDRARDEVGTCLVALTRCDRFRGWEEIRATDAAILEERYGQWVDSVIGVSSTLDAAAAELAVDDPASSATLAVESGIGPLRARLVALTAWSRHARLAGLLRSASRVADALAGPGNATDADADAKATARRARALHAELVAGA